MGSAREMGMATCGRGRDCVHPVGRVRSRASVVGLFCRNDHFTGLGVRPVAGFRRGRSVLLPDLGRVPARPDHDPTAASAKAVVLAGGKCSIDPNGGVIRVYPIQLSGHVDADSGPVHQRCFLGPRRPDSRRGHRRFAPVPSHRGVAERPTGPLGFLLGAARRIRGRRQQHGLGFRHDGWLHGVHTVLAVSYSRLQHARDPPLRHRTLGSRARRSMDALI
jgi:hypothetical protein